MSFQTNTGPREEVVSQGAVCHLIKHVSDLKRENAPEAGPPGIGRGAASVHLEPVCPTPPLSLDVPPSPRPHPTSACCLRDQQVI